MTLNSHLLQIELTVEEYKTLAAQMASRYPEAFLSRLPLYLIARCPFCAIENVERLDTYSVYWWYIGGKSVFDHRTDYHCEHFALVQNFHHFHGIWPAEAKEMLGPEVPHVIGHLLESDLCLAVIHALPICRIEGQDFVPRYTVFMVSYFSEQPGEVYKAAVGFNAPYVEEGVAWPFIEPLKGCEHWWDLRHWVAAGQLFWVDAEDPTLGIRTHDITAFPYGNITGRTWPYLHTFPYPLPKPSKPRKAKS